VATHHREVQRSPSRDFLELFPRISILSGGVRSGFRCVKTGEEVHEGIPTLLRVSKYERPSGSSGLLVYEVDSTWESLDNSDVFILDMGDKIWVRQGNGCSPKEKAKAAQAVNDMTQAKHVEVEVVSQEESGSGRVITLLGGDWDALRQSLHQPQPIGSGSHNMPSLYQPKKLFILSNATGELSFNVAKDRAPSSMGRSRWQ
jgi:gelsolin